MLFDISELVALVETVPLSGLTTEVATEFDVAVKVELATEVDAVAVAASELCEAGGRRYRWSTWLLPLHSKLRVLETVELGVTGKGCFSTKISAAVAG